MPIVRAAVVPLLGQVRIRYWLAQLLPTFRRRPYSLYPRHELRHGSPRGPLHPLRRASGARVRRRTAAHAAALLHELGFDGVFSGGPGTQTHQLTPNSPNVWVSISAKFAPLSDHNCRESSGSACSISFTRCSRL